MNLKGKNYLANSMTGQRVLVIDDVPFNRLLPGLILRPFGAEVFECSDVHEACALLDQQPVQWVLLDISMPGIDGIESLGILKSHTALNRSTPKIYAYSAYAGGGNDAEWVALGFDGVLRKPVKNQHLIDIFINK